MDERGPNGENAGITSFAFVQSGDDHVDALPDFACAGSAVASDQSHDLQQQGAQFGFINIDLGNTAESDLERKILDKVGSYGRQIGRIGDALEVILKHVKLGDLNSDEQDALDILKGQVAAVRQAKAGHRASEGANPSNATQSRPR
jgi:hypothetical protein